MFHPLLVTSWTFSHVGILHTLCSLTLQTFSEKVIVISFIMHWLKQPTQYSRSELHLSKLGICGVVTWNAVHKLSFSLVEVINAAKAKSSEQGNDFAGIIVLQSDWHNHMQNVLITVLNKHLSQYLNEMLACNDKIDFHYSISTLFDAVLRSIDKEFSLPANYPKDMMTYSCVCCFIIIMVLCLLWLHVLLL